MSSLLIEIAQRRSESAQKGSGSQVLPLTPLRSQMFTAILSVPFAIVGGQATRNYMPERMTLDWDILVEAHHIQQVQTELEAAGAHAVRPLTISGFSCLLPADELGEIPVDVLASPEPWVSAALAQAKQEALQEGQDPVIALPWLVLLKLKASRVQDLADISRMMARASEGQLEQTRQVIAQWLPDGLDDLNSLTQLGKLENE